MTMKVFIIQPKEKIATSSTGCKSSLKWLKRVSYSNCANRVQIDLELSFQRTCILRSAPDVRLHRIYWCRWDPELIILIMMFPSTLITRPMFICLALKNCWFSQISGALERASWLCDAVLLALAFWAKSPSTFDRVFLRILLGAVRRAVFVWWVLGTGTLKAGCSSLLGAPFSLLSEYLSSYETGTKLLSMRASPRGLIGIVWTRFSFKAQSGQPFVNVSQHNGSDVEGCPVRCSRLQ